MLSTNKLFASQMIGHATNITHHIHNDTIETQISQGKICQLTLSTLIAARVIWSNTNDSS